MMSMDRKQLCLALIILSALLLSGTTVTVLGLARPGAPETQAAMGTATARTAEAIGVFSGQRPGGQITVASADSTTSEGIVAAYLLAFHACDTATSDCRDPRNHRVYLAQSDDGANWSLVPGWEPYRGSVPDVIRRGNTLYVYTPGQVRRYRFTTSTWERPVPVTLADPAADGYVDPSPFVDDQGRLVLFYLLGILGQDPAQCAPGETTCVKYFHSATEVEGSDGTAFVVDPEDRVTVTIISPGSASDPDIFYDGSRYVLYISRGNSLQVYTSPTLQGSYALSTRLPDGYLTDAGGIGSGHFDPGTRRYWTYAHTTQGVIRRTVHTSLDAPLSDSDFTAIVSGSSIGLGASYRVESPGFTTNTVNTIYLPLLLFLHSHSSQGSIPPQYEVAEVLDLQTVRDGARKRPR